MKWSQTIKHFNGSCKTTSVVPYKTNVQFNVRIDKSAIAVFDSFEQAEAHDRAYWLSKTPLERLAARGLLRQITYGYDPATARLPRTFQILERDESRSSG